ncbi:hypothetical protein LTR84_003194 [Exophiala bonariae]|uniref:Anaphase-promoting complex subunit 4 WD40 domain-containing protein n=1 Tax=Exophiala bonariae TaxID=1690606 RepID=A0AAV9NAD9_9EURO|nr:hypothetical protein LTR84_003194 [Exophiala bonariae]
MVKITASDIGRCMRATRVSDQDPSTDDSLALQRPAISPNGRILAIVTPDPKIHLLDLTDTVHGDTVITRLRLPVHAKGFLQDCHIIRWSPEFMLDDDADSTTTSEADLGRTWLLLSNGRRVVAVSTDIWLPGMMRGVDGDSGSKSNILADYDLGAQFGKLTLLEFVFDHRHALLMHEHGGSATLLSLTRPQRQEIPHIKNNGPAAFAQAPNADKFALLRRDKGQDKISVFELSSNRLPIEHTFEPRSLDAQSIVWCPAGQPILGVVESPSYGLSVTFYTAQGHSLKHLDITSTNMNLARQPSNFEGVGATCLKWTNATDAHTVQAILDGQQQVFVRYLTNGSVSTQEIASFVHPDIVDGSNTLIWQEESENPLPSNKVSSFIRQKAAFSTKSSPEDLSPHAIDTVELNSDNTMIATCLKGCGKLLWIWKPEQSQPFTLIIFRHHVKYVLWHPFLPHVLIAITHQKRPIIYAWYVPNFGPISGEIVLNHEMHSNPLTTTLSTKFSASWLPAARHTDGRVPFFFTSATRFEISFLRSLDGRVLFESALRQDRNVFDNKDTGGADELIGIGIDTPSKTAKPSKKARFSVEEHVDPEQGEWLQEEAKHRAW